MSSRGNMNNARNKNYWNNTCSTRKSTSCQTHTTMNYACNSPKYNPVRNECQWRMGSYRNVGTQFNGTGAKTVFSPTTANKWLRYVNNGVRVYKFNHNDFARYFGSQWTRTTPTTARQYLKKKYGQGIKDVTRGKGNCWLIATTKNVTGRPFNNYPWA